MHRRAPAHLVTLALLLPACADPAGDTTDGAGTTADTGTADSTADPTEGAAITYHRDIKAILDRSCAGCHAPGNIAPFSLQTYDEAKAFAPALAAAVMAGTMPPWPPDNGCNTYKHDRSLPEDQRQLLAGWAELGAPEGDPADAPEPLPVVDDIAYDVELPLPMAYSPTIAPDEYRCFMMDWPKDQLKYITGFRATPGETAIVHHVIAYNVPPEQVAEYEALDAADPDPGYLCYGGPGGKRPQWIGAWVPGSSNGALPAGTGLRIEPGAKIVVQMHYHTLPGADPDRTVLQMRTADTVERTAYVVPFTNPGWPTGTSPMEIPAGDADVVHNFEADLSKAVPLFAPGGELAAGDPLVVHNAALHMHTLGTSGSIAVEHVAGGSECALDIPRWDFDWQGSYQLAAPITLQPGDKLKLECRWNNAAGQNPVYWGEGTGDEMCLGIVYITGA